MGKQARAKAARKDANALWKVLEDMGVQKRVTEAHALLNSDAFEAKFKRQLRIVTGAQQEPKGELEVAEMAKPILVEMGADLTDVVVSLEWLPHMNRMIVWKCRPDPAAILRAREAMGAKAA